MSNKKKVLLCVAGMTPQIITETLYALHKRGERIDEIRVITTLSGKKELVETLLSKDGKLGKLDEFCQDFGIDRNSIKFDETTIILLRRPDGTNLDDIRTEEENEIAGNEICRVVRELCKDENVVIHASVAGGRKTMGVYLAAAMSLFGRAEDKISHVLVSEPFESHREFFYKPPKPKELELKDKRRVSTEQAEIFLAEIPFVRLRGTRLNLFGDEQTSYKDVVTKTQSDLALVESGTKLKLNLKKKTVAIAGREAKLSPREFFVYYMFANFRVNSEGHEGFMRLEEVATEKALDPICRKLSKAWSGYEEGIVEFASLQRCDFINNLIMKPDNKKDVACTYSQIISKIAKKLEKSDIPSEKFRIKSKNINGEQMYGIEVDSTKIDVS